MDTSAGGFGSAPVTKGILVVTAAASVFIQAASANPRRGKLPRPPFPLSLVPFGSPGELFFGSLLLYFSRIFERHNGSSKYGAYVVLVSLISQLLQLGLRYTGLRAHPSGPYALLFANFVRYYFDVPSSSSFTLFGFRMTDKVFMYLAGLQLLLSSGWQSAALGLSGVSAGLIYRQNLWGLQQLRVPAPVATVFRYLFGWLADGSSAGSPGFNVHMGQGQGGPAGGHQRQQGYAVGRGTQQGGGDTQRVPSAPAPSEEAVEQLVGMGFQRDMVVYALQQTGNDVQAAIALLV